MIQGKGLGWIAQHHSWEAALWYVVACTMLAISWLCVYNLWKLLGSHHARKTQNRCRHHGNAYCENDHPPLNTVSLDAQRYNQCGEVSGDLCRSSELRNVIVVNGLKDSPKNVGRFFGRSRNACFNFRFNCFLCLRRIVHKRVVMTPNTILQ